MSLNKISPSVTTAAVLIVDEQLVYANGSNDAIPQMTKDGNNETVSAALEIQSTSGGLLIPRMTTAEMNALLPYDGMMIYNTTDAAFYGYSGGLWAALGGGGGGGAPTTSTFITKTNETGTLPNSQPLSLLSTGLMKSTTGTGVISTAVAGTDYVDPSALTPILNAPYITKTDVTSTFANSQPLSLLATGLMKSTTGTGVVSTAVAGTDYALPASVPPIGATYITQTVEASLTGSQPLSALTTGILKSTTGTGVVSIAVAGTDYYSPGFPTFIFDTNGTANNFYIGAGSGGPAVGATSSIGIGANALSVSTGARNTAVGFNAMKDSVSNTDVCAFGNNALAKNINSGGLSPEGNCAFGSEAMMEALAVEKCIAIGYQALKFAGTTGNCINNVALGYISLFSFTSGNNNLAIGSSSLTAMSSGDNNVAIGVASMQSAVGAAGNVAIGTFALAAANAPSDCVAIGYNACVTNQSNQTTGVGSFSLLSNTSGNFNTGLGFRSLWLNAIGSNNTAVGYTALGATGNSAINSSGNTGVGTNAGGGKQDMTNCTFVGYNALPSVEGLTNATAIGANTSVSTSDTTVLGSGGTLQVKGTIGGFPNTQMIRKQDGVQLIPAASTVFTYSPPVVSGYALAVTATILVAELTAGVPTTHVSAAPTTMSALNDGTTYLGMTFPPTIVFAGQGALAVTAVWGVSAGGITLTVTGDATLSTSWIITTEYFAAQSIT